MNPPACQSKAGLCRSRVVLPMACLVLSVVSACANGCDAKNALWVMGKPYGEELAEKARLNAGAAIVRRMGKGSADSAVFIDGRLNLVVEKK
jgi:hypothetical protein